ncbi:hypothetical protein TVAG_132380 [Trichomonas vaginalis G3]|uniref:Uncharacterized protein n=1 Tax=Trichomonas vaginalis (strain ATCC PRA-98 / G3) TaxID=412133 RepID=A2G7U5_TRIV3|nr:hypothetical protein TVAGG3_0017210 [Trichomonas vaginalis G3]EAX86770.1 hypothetical protein TVAG_132380 [Trichomonas vaginalis G3]KAI5539452.1 hypothetical protein TVAGG3_0017210 [Trichomonas vaginalis G3]|eukprot:XP_001299700.1 hypothetical protein [Trichomonas vaginalis G3]
MTKSTSKQLESLENIKGHLKQYSRLLRRDFLAILVKMTAKEFGIRTVRCDWRTRKGMLAFLQSSWDKFYPQLTQETVFKWYCTNFEACEKLFSIRKFIMFIYSNWNLFNTFLTTPEAISCLRSHSRGIETLLESQSVPKNFEWLETEAGKKILDIVCQFKSGQTSKLISEDEEMVSSPEENSQKSVENTDVQPIIPIPAGVTDNDDEIDLEFSLSLFPHEFNLYETKEIFHFPAIDDPFLMDNFSI